jgi:hypothetical protein
MSASKLFGETLDRVSEHRARHSCRVDAKKFLLDLLVALPDFAEHPPDRFMDEVVSVVNSMRAIANVVSNSPALM